MATPQHSSRVANPGDRDVSPTALIPAFVNAEAGNADSACDALRKMGCFSIERVAPTELPERVRAAVQAGARRVLIAGGDGSISSAAEALCGADCELAILPAGTLNHLAQDLGLPEDLEEAARVATGDTIKSIDVGDVNGRIFLNTCSVGAYVTFVRTRDRLERWLRYWLSSFVAALRILARLPTVRVTLEVRGRQRDYDTPLVFIGLGERELRLPTLGARKPGGRRGLHVMVVRSRSGARILALAFAAAARGIRAVATTPALDSFIVDSLSIEPRRHALSDRVAVDGEIVGVDPPLEYRLRRGVLKVVVGAVEASRTEPST